jgi:hypothetical protein
MSVRSTGTAAALLVAIAVAGSCGVKRPVFYPDDSGSASSTPGGESGQDAAQDVAATDIQDARTDAVADHPRGADATCYTSVTIDGGTPFAAICPARCPPGMVCVTELGAGHGQYCAPIPNACNGVPTCGCMAACVCTNVIGGIPEACSSNGGPIVCDNGVR